MVACAEFLGRDKASCTRGIGCVCREKEVSEKKPRWVECSACNGHGFFAEFEDRWECHQCAGEGGYYDN